MKRQTIVSGVTLTVLALVLAGMALWGFRAATAPVDAGTSSDGCTDDELQVQRTISRGDVEVSVFNAGGSSGLAGRTRDRLEGAGFVPGEAGNAPADVQVRRAVVWTTERDDTAARLVARSLGGGAKVRVVDQDLGPGVDVLVGDGLKRLDAKAPTELELPEPIEQCIRVD